MNYNVVLTLEASIDIDTASEWFEEHMPEQADRWLSGIHAAIQKLAMFPERCPLARDRSRLVRTPRKLLYGDSRHAYRILFEIVGSQVRVYQVRHCARSDP